MTVIAWDGKALSADKRMHAAGGVPNGTVTKVKRLEDGSLVAWCGSLNFCMAVVKWIEAGEDEELARHEWWEHEEFSASVLRIMPDGSVWLYDHMYPVHVETPFYAIGSGAAYAMATMELGYDSVKAVEVASKYDSGCGNGIDTLTLEE